MTFKDSFEDYLNINTNDFNLSGFDFNVDIMTDYPPSSYLPIIRTLPKYTQSIYTNGTGITFLNNCKSFNVYDKIKQLNKLDETIPQEYANSHLLRLELSVKRKMKQTKNLAAIDTLNDLINPKNYILAIDEFESIYKKIHKQPILKYENMIQPNPKNISITDFALLFYINEIGMNEYINQLVQEKNMGILTYRQWKGRKDKAIELWDTYNKLDTYNTIDLLAEMNNKVANKIIQVKQLALIN